MILFVVAGIALIGLLPMPYVGYTLVRIGVTGACLLAFFNLNQDNQPKIVGIEARYLLILIGLLYNPIFPIWLTREIWIVIDLIVAGITIYLGLQITSASQAPSTLKKEKLTQTDRINEQIDIPKPLSSSQLKSVEKKTDSYMSRLFWQGIFLLALVLITTAIMKS